MTYRGTVKNGVVVLEESASLSDGTLVRVEPVADAPASDEAVTHDSGLFRAADRARETGIADLALNHDHYLYGHPKVTDV